MFDAVVMIGWWIALAIIPPTLLFLWRRRQQRSWQWWCWWLPVVCASVFIAFYWPGFLATRKILAQLLLPPGCLWSAAAIGMWISAAYKNWRIATICAVTFCLLTLLGSRPLGNALLQHLALQVHDQRQAFTNGSISAVQTAVVLGGGTVVNEHGQPALAASGDRLRLAAAGYHRGWYSTIIVTGSAIAGLTYDPDPQGSARGLLVDMGVPHTAIIPINSQTRTTAEELDAISQWLQHHPNQRLALVTSAWHLPRAMRLAQHRNIDDRLIPLAAEAIEPMPLTPEKLIPHGTGFTDVQRAAWEWVGLLIP